MNCAKIQKLIGPGLDNELSEKQREAVDAHLKRCAGCLLEYKALKEISGQIHSLKLNWLAEDNNYSEYWNTLKNKIDSTRQPSLREEFINLLWESPGIVVAATSFIFWLRMTNSLMQNALNNNYFEYLLKGLGLILRRGI